MGMAYDALSFGEEKGLKEIQEEKEEKEKKD